MEQNYTENEMLIPPNRTPSAFSRFMHSDAGELIRFAIIALLIIIPIRIFIAQPFIVSGTSMFPTFENREYLIVDELSYRLHKPERGDVVIFRYPKDPSKFFIKRVIGLPNETISISGGNVTIVNAEHKDGMALSEPYIENHSEDSYGAKKLGPDEYFVMGDNRTASSDSRYWGVLQKKLVVGRALFRLFPVSRLSVLPGEHENY